MAERTGNPELDALIEAFIEEDTFNPDHPEAQGNEWSLESFREPAEAAGYCTHISIQLSDWLCERGITAFLPWEEKAQALGDANRFWYPELPQHLKDAGHCLVYVERGGVIFAVDFAASQYGFSEFPLVQRLDGAGVWQRDWPQPA